MSRDPIGYGAGDANLYNYCSNIPLTEVDPYAEKEARWEQVVAKEPTLNGATGFKMEVKQRLYDYKPRVDSQTWQTNLARYVAYVCAGGECKLKQSKPFYILDVLHAKADSPFSLLDTVNLTFDPEGGQVCFLFYHVERQLGLSPMKGPDGRTNTLKEDVNYQASNEEWELAKLMQIPKSPSVVEYTFIDPDVCRNCSMDIQNKVDTISKAIWGPKGASGKQFPTEGSAAMLRYFGQTPIREGRERKGVWTKSFPRNEKGC